MKLAFSTLGNPDWSFDKTLSKAQELGFGAIEIRGVEGNMLAHEITQFLPQNQSETKLKLAAHNMKICGFGTSVSFHDSERYAAMIEEGKNAIDVCTQMSIPFIRIFGDRIVSETLRGEVIRRIIKGTRELCAHAECKNVKVLLEVHGDFNTIENIMEVADEVKDRSEFGILWDVAHSDRSYGDAFKKFYDVIKPILYHIHIKDHIRENGNFKLCLVGHGDVPLKEIINTLRDDGYTGYFSLEWEKRWHPQLEEPEIAYPAYVEFMNTIVK